MAPSTEDATAEELEWFRPHPFTIVIEIGSALRSIVLALVVVRGGFLQAGTAIEMAVVITPLAAALGRWYTTRYALGTQSVHYRYGLIRRRKQVLPRANVQNVSTKAGLVARLGSVVELQISDASSSGDIKLRLVSQAEADRISSLLRSDRPAADVPIGVDTTLTLPPPALAGSDGETAQDVAGLELPADTAFALGPVHVAGAVASVLDVAPQGTPVWRPADVEPSLPMLVRAEATSSSVVMAVLVALAIPLVGLVARWRLELGDIDRWPLALAVGPAAVVAIAAASVLQRLSVLGGFQLYAEPDRLRIQAGLLTEARITARRERIQLLQVQRDPAHRRLGIERIRYETADIEAQGSAATTFLDPAGTTDSWLQLADIAIGGTRLRESDLQPVSPVTVRRAFIRSLVPLGLIAAVVALVMPLAIAPVLLAGLGIARWHARRRYRVLGWVHDDEHCLIRSGVLTTRLHLIRLDKIQALRSHATLFQRRLRLADIGLSTAGIGGTSNVGLVRIPDLPVATANELLETFAARAARTPLADTL